MNARKMKDQIYEIIAQIGKTASSPKRLELLDVLCQGEKTVEDLAEYAGITLNLTSAHLKVLRGARLVKGRKVAEVGWHEISLLDIASEDKVLSGLDKTLWVYQWHWERFATPPGAVALAHSNSCGDQVSCVRPAISSRSRLEVSRKLAD